MGPLSFAKPLNVFELVKGIKFNNSDTIYDKQIPEMFEKNHVSVEDGSFAMGEVSSHHNLSFHTAAGNRITKRRVVLANTYFSDGARVVKELTMVSDDWQQFIPGIAQGEIVLSELHPIFWPINTKKINIKT